MVRGESIANYDGRISRRRGDNVRVKVKNVGCCGLVSLIVNPEIDSLAPRFERGVRVPLLNLSQTPANLRPLVVNVPPDELLPAGLRGWKGASSVGRGPLRISGELGLE